MDSIIEPLAEKSAVFLNSISSARLSLNNGDPEAKKRITMLVSELRLFKQDCKSIYAQMLSGQQMALDTSTSLLSLKPPGIPLIRMIQYYIVEVVSAIKLVSNLIKIAEALVSVGSLLIFFNNDLIAAQQSLNTKTLWLTRSLTRTKQKLIKNVEWDKRTGTAKSNIEYLKIQITRYQKTLLALQQNSTISSTQTQDMTSAGSLNTVTAANAVNSKISSANIAINSGNVGDSNNQINIQNRIVSLTQELEETQKELDIYIPSDKKFWGDKWKIQEQQDRDQLLNNTPHIGN